MTSRTQFKLGRTSNKDTGSALETNQLPKDMRHAILFSMCPTDLERELTAQQHLFPAYAQMRAHIVTVINSRTRGPAPMMMGNLNDEALDKGVKVEIPRCLNGIWFAGKTSSGCRRRQGLQEKLEA